MCEKSLLKMMGKSVQRFGVVAVLAVALFASASSDASAENPQSLLNSTSEWNDGFDATPRSLRNQNRTDRSPILGTHAVPYLMKAIEHYSDIVAAGGWQALPSGPVLRLGTRHQNVLLLRERLAVSSDLSVSSGNSNVFDSYVDAAVRRFQARHGIVADGVVGENTLEALNVPAYVRLAQLRTNLGRLASFEGSLGERYAMVNVPGAEIELVENGWVESRHTAVVGKIDRQTPLLTSRIHEINFNPFWTVPKSIIRKDIIPLMQEDPDYLSSYNIRILDNRGGEIDPAAVNWNTEEAVNYTFRQDPGAINSLGHVRINFHNPHSVYLHDTPTKSLFASNSRFHSSGCVRVQNVREFVNWLLRSNGDWNRAKVDAAIRSGERLDVKIKSPVPVYFVYITAWATTEGTVNFRPDVYNRDGFEQTALQQTPVTTQ